MESGAPFNTLPLFVYLFLVFVCTCVGRAGQLISN